MTAGGYTLRFTLLVCSVSEKNLYSIKGGACNTFIIGFMTLGNFENERLSHSGSKLFMRLHFLTCEFNINAQEKYSFSFL